MIRSGQPREARFLECKRRAIESFVAFAEGRELPAHPLELYLEVSNVCDLRCAMCPRFSALNPGRMALIRSEARGFMAVDEVLSSVEELLPHALLVNVFGYGEPTLHPDFARLLERVARYEVLVDFFTSGMHLDDGTVALLVELGVRRVTVSLSGSTAEEYENVYLGGDLRRVLAGLSRLRDRRREEGSAYPLVEVNSIAFRHHVRSLDRFVALAAEHGVDQVNLTPLHEHAEAIPALAGHAVPLGSLAHDPIVLRARAVARELGVRLSVHPALLVPPSESSLPSRAESGAPPPVHAAPTIPIASFRDLARSSVVEPAPGDFPTLPEPFDPKRDSIDTVRRALRMRSIRDLAAHGGDFVCLEPFKTLYVRRNGEVKPCCYMADDVAALGHVGRSTGSDIWKGRGFRAVRHGLLNGEYPLAGCWYCLTNQQAPPGHGLEDRLAEYASWFESRFAETGLPAIAGEASRALSALGDGKAIVGRMVDGGSPLLLDDELLERAREVTDSLSRERQLEACDQDVLEGFVDLPSGGQVTGWIWSPRFPELRFTVACWVDGQLHDNVVAQFPRPDVEATGRGDGRYGFGFRIDPGMYGRSPVDVRLFLGETRCELPGSPRRVGESG